MKNAKITASPERQIQIIGQIDDDNTRNFFEHMNALEHDGKENIEIELHSEGGFAYNALAIVGRMRQSKCKIIVTGYSLASSAAVMVLAAGDYRRLSRESTVQVHEDSGKQKGTVSQMEDMSRRFRIWEEKWAKYLEQYTGTSASTWAQLHKNDTYLEANECLKLGLIEEII